MSLQTKASPQTNTSHSIIKTTIGNIACYIKEIPGTTPIIFLHGVYYDHNLWNYYTSRITDRTTISIDMPLHGQSKQITKNDWSMEDCAQMLTEILDSLNIKKCYAVGHSWGSMTVLRVAANNPERFQGILLCNMPLEEGNLGKKLTFGLQHPMLSFRGFYTKQAGKTMFSAESRQQKPELMAYLKSSMGLLSNKEIRTTDKAVITKVESGFPYLEKLNVPALALKGNEDYVPVPENIEMTIVPGKHTSPLEQPERVWEIMTKLMKE